MLQTARLAKDRPTVGVPRLARLLDQAYGRTETAPAEVLEDGLARPTREQRERMMRLLEGELEPETGVEQPSETL